MTNAPLYVGIKKIKDDLRIPFFTDHFKALRASTRSWLMRGTPWFGNFESICAYEGLSEVIHG
jgi:hypothetical protein